MKHHYLLIALLVLALLPAAAAKTYNENTSFKIEGEVFNISGVSSGHNAVFFENEYGDFAIQEDDCKDRDIYLLCVENISYDPVEYWPDEYEIEFTWEKICTECVAWGQKCSNESEKVCQDECVHNTCRPDDPWCGDGYCDEGEDHQSCSADCEAPVTNTTTNQTSNQTSQNASEPEDEQPSKPENTQETRENQTAPAQTTSNDTNESTSEPSSQQEPDGPASDVVEDSPNWLGAAITIFGGFVLIFVVFNRKKGKDDDEDLYSYK